jgi:diguanylate cyclase (GGDEF)-like protein
MMQTTRFSTSFGWPHPQADSSALLVRIYPEHGIGQPFDLGRETIEVGRESADILLRDDSVSRRHATIQWTGTHHIVSDFGSTNGTFVNEERISSKRLTAGDRVRFGKQLFKYLPASSDETAFHEVVFKIMTTDGLTETQNKNCLLQAIERELQITSRTNSPLSLMLLDIDFFKKINDSFGHLAGDEVLRQFAARVKSVMRRGDLLSRFGGEEFAVLCPQTELKDALHLASRICHQVSATPVFFEAHSIPVTVSIGVVDCDTTLRSRLVEPTCDWSAEAANWLAKADQFLYQAKREGRNRFCYPVPAPSDSLIS